MAKITIFQVEPPRKRNRMLVDVPLWMWMLLIAGCAAILVLDYLQ